MLFSAYRKDDFADPDGFVAQLGVILCDYPEEVVTYITGPKTGLQRTLKWPPTISEVVKACEDHIAYLERSRRAPRVALPRLPAPMLKDMPQGTLANIFVPEGHHRYQSLAEWAEDADHPYWSYGHASDGRRGIWVNGDIWSFGPPAKKQVPEDSLKPYQEGE